MRESPMMDEAGFARAIEDAYRQMWQAYCLGTTHPAATRFKN